MAVTSCQEIDLESTRSFRVALMDGTTCRRTFRIRTDDVTDLETAVYFQAQSVGPQPLPAPLSFFPGSGLARSYQYDIVRDKAAALCWIATVDYKTIFNQQELDRNTYQDPTLRPTKISGGSRTIMQAIRSCLRYGPYVAWPGGNPTFRMGLAANSASDPLDPPIEVDSIEWDLHFEKNVAALPTWFLKYSNGVNVADQIVMIQGVLITIPKGCGKLGEFTFSDHKQENNVDFITIAWNTICRYPRQVNEAAGETVANGVPSPWDVERLDEGTRYRDSIGSSTIWHNVRDATQSCDITTPVPFNGYGREVTANGSAIPEIQLYKYCYRPNIFVDYSVMPWT